MISLPGRANSHQTRSSRCNYAIIKNQRHRVAHEVVAGPGYRQMSIVLWLKILVMLRVRHGEKLTVNSPILVRMNRKKLVPMTGDFMRRMDKIYAPRLGWRKATLHSRRRGFATAAVRSGIHMANITIAMRHSQGVTMQYVSLPLRKRRSSRQGWQLPHIRVNQGV